MIPLFLLAAAALAPTDAMTLSEPASSKPPMRSVGTTTALRRFDDAIATEQAAFDDLPMDAGIGRNLSIRIALEQAMRRAIGPIIATLIEGEKKAAADTIWRRISAVDAANTAYVRSVLPADGWFRIGRDGDDVAHQAWLIVQHSPDAGFQRQILARMLPLVASGDARGADYALLFDRTEMLAGRRQLYGSQVTCRNGRFQPLPLVMRAMVDRRRADVGLPPMREYLRNFERSC